VHAQQVLLRRYGLLDHGAQLFDFGPGFDTHSPRLSSLDERETQLVPHDCGGHVAIQLGVFVAFLDGVRAIHDRVARHVRPHAGFVAFLRQRIEDRGAVDAVERHAGLRLGAPGDANGKCQPDGEPHDHSRRSEARSTA
jgi:hypothetical protein